MIVPLNDLGYDPEFALVGCLITFCDRVTVPTGVSPEWFKHPAARTIFGVIEDLNKRGLTPMPVAVRRRLEELGHWEAIGGEDFFADIMTATSSPTQVATLVGVLEPQFVKRKTVEIARWLNDCSKRDDITSGELSDRLLEAAAITSGVTRSPVISIGDVEHGGDDIGVSTGFSRLDYFTSCGGYPAGQTSVISAYHKGGKTSFMLSSALRQLQQGKRVLYATFADLNRKQIKRRLLRNLCGWSKPPDNLHLLQDYDEALAWLNAAPLDIYDASALDAGYDVETFSAWVRANHDRKGYHCIFGDYAQKIRTVNKRVTNVFAEGDYCSAALAKLASRIDLPVVIGSQITEGKEGSLTRTKNSRAWEEDAGLVLRLKHPNGGSLVEVKVPYSRFGPSGLEATLDWNSERLRMEE